MDELVKYKCEDNNRKLVVETVNSWTDIVISVFNTAESNFTCNNSSILRSNSSLKSSALSKVKIS